jgi:LruC domain-containing protein
MKTSFERNLLGLGLLSALALPGLAHAQDSDGDGVQNAADAFPCDAARASVSFFPGESTSALLAFEDQWPDWTDHDYNDVAVRVHYRLERNGQGSVVQLHAVIDPVALGGDYSNGLGLALPVSRGGVTARRRVGGGAWEALALEPDGGATVLVSGNLRELFDGVAGPINAGAGGASRSGKRLELQLDFATPVALAVQGAPFDVFVFRTEDPGHQIHLPQYAGTAAMNTALFNSGFDLSTPTRRFVNPGGVPAALNLMTTSRYPLEGTRISALFPDIVAFATSGGAEAAGFYESRVEGAYGLQVAATALPAVAAPSTACVANLITVTSATYGANCGRPTGNVTASVASTCNGRTSCSVFVSNSVFGDPAPGCPKAFVASYTCSNGGSYTGSHGAVGGENYHVNLSCP